MTVSENPASVDEVLSAVCVSALTLMTGLDGNLDSESDLQPCQKK